MTPPATKGTRLVNASTGLGRVCFVTGAASAHGMGHASAVLLALQGARVIVSDLPKMASEGLKVVDSIRSFGGQAVWVPLDVSQESEWPRAIEDAEDAFGPLDVMMANAGVAIEYESYTVNENESLVDHPTEDWRRILSVNQVITPSVDRLIRVDGWLIL